MKITSLFFCASLLLAANSFKAPRLPKDIIGFWVFKPKVTEDANGYKHGFYEVVKSKKAIDKKRPYWEFRKNGSFVENRQTSFCGNGEIEFKSLEGKWEKLSDSTVSVSYSPKESTRIICLSKETTGELRLRYLN